MDIKEFEDRYLNHYFVLEQDFLSTINFVTVEPNNFDTYSIEYLKLILSLGSEIDVLKKELAKLYEPTFDNDKGNSYETIKCHFPDLSLLKVEYKGKNMFFYPWVFTAETNWWQIYNGIKHNRLSEFRESKQHIKFYQLANLNNVLLMLSALFSLELVTYREISIRGEKDVWFPIKKSIFSIRNSFWENINHCDGSNVYNNTLILD